MFNVHSSTKKAVLPKKSWNWKSGFQVTIGDLVLNLNQLVLNTGDKDGKKSLAQGLLTQVSDPGWKTVQSW